MTTCDDVVDDLAPFVLDTLEAERRARVVQHVAGCRRCEHDVAEIRRVVDDVLLSAPHREPPPAFEARALAGFGAVVSPPPRLRRGRVLLAVAALVAVAVGAAGLVLQQTSDERRLGASYRRQLEEASGDYFVARRMHGTEGSAVLFAYEGHPSWALVTVRDVDADEVTIAVRSTAGVEVERPATPTDGAAGQWSWGEALPFDVHSLASARVEADGVEILRVELR